MPRAERRAREFARAEVSPAQFRRIVDLAKVKAIDPRMGSALGRHRLMDNEHDNNRLLDRHVSHGFSYADMIGRYDRLKGYEKQALRSPAYEMGFERAHHEVKLLDEMEPEEVDDLRSKITTLHRQIQDVDNRLKLAGVIGAVHTVVLFDQALDWCLRPDLRRGLEIIADWYDDQARGRKHGR